MHKRTILISNDDSIYSDGIRHLVEVAKLFGRVVVVAPDKPQSAKSHSTTISEPISINKSEIFGSEIEAYSCTGTPTDCVKFAVNHLFKSIPDLVLSGINHGSNYSVNTLYSGTVAAAIEGYLHDIPSIAFSVTNHEPENKFEAAKKYCEQIIKEVLDNNLQNICLNVNIPHIDNPIKGIKICNQCKGVWKEEYDSFEEKDNMTFQISGCYVNLEPNNQETDSWAIKKDYVTIVPIQINLTDYSKKEKLNKIFNK